MSQSANLAQARPIEVALSPDGSKVYASGADGVLRVYDVGTGALVHAWQVGLDLGGLDISPDGSFLMVIERDIAARVYKIDTTTGAKTVFHYPPADGGTTFFDAAVLSNNKVLLTRNFSGSGWGGTQLLDLATGQFESGPAVNQSSVLTRSGSGSKVLIGEVNSSGGPLDIYRAGTGIVAQTGSNGYNWGIQAYTASGDMVAQYIYNEGINIYNSALQRQLVLTGWNWGRVSDLAFDRTGAYLFVLDNQADAIFQLRVSDWTTVATIAVNADVGSWAGQIGATTGNRLIVDPELRYFSVVTETGLLLVENPGGAPSGTDGEDWLEGTLFDETIYGRGGYDRLFGHSGDDVLDGGAGADRLEGGAGSDTYFVDNAGDVVVEAAGAGIDRIYASASFKMGAEVENLELIGVAGINAAGNGLANVLTGNSGDNWLAGLAGNDVLDGGAGVDRLEGGIGDDSYYVDNVGDLVVEKAGEGTDLIYAAFTYKLGAEVENLTLTGSAALNGAGNALANRITGNGAANWLAGREGDDVLDGGAGADRLEGGVGNDRYVVDSAGDVVVEAADGGADTVEAWISYTLGANVESLVLMGSAAIDGTGNALANKIFGNGASNVLSGGAGTDAFVFDTALGAGNVDTLADFVVKDDTIHLDRTIFAGIAANGTLSAGAFRAGTAAVDADDRILYDAATGNLWYDADGSGDAAAVQFARVATGLALTNADFFAVP